MSEYNPNGLLDAVSAKLLTKNDAALARALEVAPSVISEIRHYRLMVGASIIFRLLESNIMTLPEIRAFVPRSV